MGCAITDRSNVMRQHQEKSDECVKAAMTLFTLRLRAL
jgi:hypothetical protein